MKYMEWAILLSALSLAGCATSASNCAGWQKLTPSPATAVTLPASDQQFAKQVVSHNRYGVAQGCWK